MRIAFDTNVVGYADGLDDPARRDTANDVMAALVDNELALPVQVAAELHRLLMRRRRVDPAEASLIVQRWMELFTLHPTTDAATIEMAFDLATTHHLQIFDAIILAASAKAGCHMLLSEDMQDGFVWRGVTVVNPFAATPHPMLVDLMRA